MNKSNMGIIGINHQIARPSDLDTVRKIVEMTINEIYPLYYPCDVVQFFLDHHAPDRILSDIEAKRVYLFGTESITVGTGTVHENEIKRVFVLPEFRGKGFGSIIMDQLEDIAFRGHRIAKLDSSFPAFPMYLKRGYKPRAWREIVVHSGQVLCYHEMEKENVAANPLPAPSELRKIDD